MSSNNSSLRPGWFKGSGAGGGKGFQPPPTASDRGDKGRSNSNGSGDNEIGGRRDSNIFAALLDDEDAAGSGVGDGNGVVHASESSSKPPPVISSSRSEAFRSSFNRSSSSGSRRSLADLAARVPELSSSSGHGGRRHHSGGLGGSGRFSHIHSHDGGSGGPSGSSEGYKADPKVIRYTREKLLSLRFAPRGEDPGPPEELKAVEGSVIISSTAQDPVCWDTFDAEEIWEMAREQRRSSSAISGKSMGGLEDQRRRTAPSSGRWSRGLALPPPEDGSKRKGDVDNPNELWDDPVGGVIGAASDFSSFGALPTENGEAFDFDKMAEASAKLELELHGDRSSGDDADHNSNKKIDVSRPLASAGTTLISGSGNDVNVFEDFDTPVTSDSEGENNAVVTNEDKETVAVRGGDEDPNASSRLMKMIGVSRDPTVDSANHEAKPLEPSSNPWGSSTNLDLASKTTTPTDPIIGGIAGVPSNAGGTSISLNPWGDPIISASTPSQQTGASGSGMTLGGIHISAFSAEEKNREAQIAAEREKIARHEAELLARRRHEEEKEQRRLLAQQQQQQNPPRQSQIELVLMERICTILENSWGRSDLMSILRTLHSEDARVIQLLRHIDALRALIARSPQRVSLRRDPSLAGEIAVLVMTNAQWQEQQQQQQHIQARMQQEELRRRHMEEEAKARLQAQNQLTQSIKKDVPWYYSDPQNNIQGPFRGEEMRQWLEAGYFKGDLPISQLPNGPFHQLSNWFPNLSTAFTAEGSEGRSDRDDGAVLEQQRKNAEAAAEAERQRAAEEMEAKKKAEEEAAAAAAQKEAQKEAARSREIALQNEEVQAPANGGNQSSNQLKMMLGLSSGEKSDTLNKISETSNGAVDAKKANKTSSKGALKKSSPKTARPSGAGSQPEPSNQPVDPDIAPAPAPVPVAPAVPAWGGVANNKPKKSMSEIQKEEARAAAILAAKRGNMAQTNSSGWANVAAGSTGWSSGAIRTVVQNPAPVTSVRPGQAPSKPQTKKVVSSTQKAAPASSSTPAEEFGTTMSPALEKWCKEKMQLINGSDDLTLVAFCMTLNDASEIRQYLTTYLGSTSQVNNFATDFINKRGLGSKQEEWETPGSAKKGRKKKSGR